MDTIENKPDERNEPAGATFNLTDPYEKPLDTAAPIGETSNQEAETQPEQTGATPVVSDNADHFSMDEGSDETVPPPIPVEMKESLDDYIDEELAANVKALVEKVASLESNLQQEKTKTRAAAQSAAKVGEFAGVWDSEIGKYGEVLSGDDAKDRIRDAMGILRAGYKASQMDIPTDTSLFEKAVSSEYGASMVEAREKEITEQVEKRQNQFVSRAAATTPIRERPEEVAAKAVHRMMVDRGMYES